MRELLQARRVRIVIAIAMLLSLLVLLVPHAASQGYLLAWVLFCPVFLFGLLGLPWFVRVAIYAEEGLLPQAPVLNALFQRPPPSLD